MWSTVVKNMKKSDAMILKSLLHQNAKHMLKKFKIKKTYGYSPLQKRLISFCQTKNIFPAAISEECTNENKFPMEL